MIVEFLQIQIPTDRTTWTRTRATQMLTNTIVEICSTPLTTAPWQLSLVFWQVHASTIIPLFVLMVSGNRIIVQTVSGSERNVKLPPTPKQTATNLSEGRKCLVGKSVFQMLNLSLLVVRLKCNRTRTIND